MKIDFSNNKLKIGLGIIGLLIIFMISLFIYFNFFYKESDSYKFKKDYEKLNGEKLANGKTYLSMEIDKNNPIKNATLQEILNILDGKTGVILFGFPECPWCRSSIPVLLDAAKEAGIDTIYYNNALNDRDVKKLEENGTIITSKEGSKEYYELLDKLKNVLSPYDGLNQESIKRLYFPTVLFVKDGKVLHMNEGTSAIQEDPFITLSEDQRKELLNTYIENMNSIMKCDEKC